MSRSIDKCWDSVFEHYKILESLRTNDTVEITSSQLNKFKEARLLAKIDHNAQLSKIFKDNDLGILPTSRGRYAIGKFEIFENFNTNIPELAYMEFPSDIESIDYTNITSEAMALNCAFVSKILQDFTGEYELTPTVNGRMRSSEFTFNIKANKKILPISVCNSQLEIDGGYEGDNSLVLIEAKNYISDDFIIRQLYYPYRLWDNRISKSIRPIYVVYSNGIYHLREYKFNDKNLYNSIELVNQKRYKITDNQIINTEVIEEIISNAQSVQEPQIPFPQADSFERIINLCEIIKENDIVSGNFITANYGFTSRQTDYYVNAAKYLNLVEDSKTADSSGYILTVHGKSVFELPLFERQIEFIRLIISHEVFKKVLNDSFENGEIIDEDQIVTIMKHSNLHNINSDSTYYRRASTITSWLNWILSQIKE